jgi:23S rRNA (adenine-N6)-dimethyltransferase
MTVLDQPQLSHSQNFMDDARLAAALIERSSLSEQDVVLEIGPGPGTLTAELARRCKQVIAVEKDPSLAVDLRQRLAALPNLALHTGDFLDHPLPRKPYKVFANIPFGITTAIIERLTGAPNPPEDAYLVIQLEAAQMFLGRPRQTLKALLLYPWFELSLAHRFRRSDFTPRPQVHAVLLRIRKRSPPLLAAGEARQFRDFVTYAFTAWKTTLEGTLKELFSPAQRRMIRREMNLSPYATPSALSAGQWLRLFAAYRDYAGPRARAAVSGSEKRLRRRQDRLEKVRRTRKGGSEQ